MSDTSSSLIELARFVGRSTLSAEDAERRNAAISNVATKLLPQADKRSVADLLGAVLALSARTRRMLMPQTHIELDVFAPGGIRAVRMILPTH